ncbi:MAG: hypothetical protein H0W66_10975 [Chthoniobacterales bacterium]|nr:hypothetical protein [Chthoniobacterales bacterium]
MPDLIEQNSAPCALRRRGLVFLYQIKHALRAGQDIGVDRGGFIELKHLRHVTDDKVTAAIELARIGRHDAGGNLQESRFSGAVAADQPDTFTFQKSDGSLVEDDLIAEANGEFRSARNSVWDGFSHFLT